MSNAVLEANEQGRPGLASDIEGNARSSPDGEDGFLFASRGIPGQSGSAFVDDPGAACRHGERAG